MADDANVTGSNNNPPVNQCPVCLQQFSILKVLPCKHIFCNYCFQSLTLTRHGGGGVFDGFHEYIKCSLDRQEFVIDYTFKVKLFAPLKCENCDAFRDYNKTWWCDDCSKSACGNCAMTNHRHHVCNPWGEFAPIHECYSACNMFEGYNISREKIDKWCENLKKELVALLPANSELKTVTDRMMQVFGPANVNSHDNNLETCHYTNWCKKSRENKLKQWKLSLPVGRQLPELDKVIVKVPEVKDVINLFMKGARQSTNAPVCDVCKELNADSALYGFGAQHSFRERDYGGFGGGDRFGGDGGGFGGGSGGFDGGGGFGANRREFGGVRRGGGRGRSFR